MKLPRLLDTMKLLPSRLPKLPLPSTFLKLSSIPGLWLQKTTEDPYNPYDTNLLPDPSVITILRHLRRRDWYILMIGLPIVFAVVFYAVFLNFPNGALDNLEDPTFKGIVTIDELPKCLAGSPENISVASSSSAVLISPNFEQLQKVIEDMASTNSDSAHLVFVTFTNDRTHPNFQRGDYIDVRVTAPVAKAMAENLQPDTVTDQDLAQTFSFVFPPKSFDYFTLSARANLQNLFWRTDLTLEQVTTYATVLALVLTIAFVLWFRYAYREAACEANWEIIIRNNSKCVSDYLNKP